MDKLNPDTNGGKYDKGSEALDKLVIAGSNASCVFHAIEEPLDAVT